LLTFQKTRETCTLSLSTSGKAIDELLGKQWLLTNQRGSYASSTVVGCNTSSYHGLLAASVNQPADRIMTLANCLEMVISGPEVFDLSTFEFSERFAPAGFGHIKRFRRDVGVHFDYDLEPVQLSKSIYLLRESDTVVLAYDFAEVKRPIEFVVRPFVVLRDFHGLQRSYAALRCKPVEKGISVRHEAPSKVGLFLSCPCMNFQDDPQWWFNFVYRDNKVRGQDFTEDLWTPGFFKCRIDAPAEIVFRASLCQRWCDVEPPIIDISIIKEDLQKHRDTLIDQAGARGKESQVLCLTADQFVVKRKTKQVEQTAILAGFPWFAAWGRDSFISLPGLLLCTKRFEEARSVLMTFAAVADEGMIPNRFDDRSDEAHFNSVDASLWFINAAFQYLIAAEDSKTFAQDLLPVIRWIVDSYEKGARFNIHADSDGLIVAGDQTTQLTWMDAKCNGVAFTPRWGKAVEVNALWYNALCLLANYYVSRSFESSRRYRVMAEKVGESFCRLFWNPQKSYLNDVVLPDGSVDATIRPNQIFAVSLPFSPLLSFECKCAVIDVVQKELLTPYGLRTLSPSDPAYKGSCEGPQRKRDEAYHQGTVWSYLMGPFVEGYLKVNDFSRSSKRQAAKFIQPLLQHLTEEACMGSISEIFDGDAPHKPRGCFAQAWSVAELIRANHLIEG